MRLTEKQVIDFEEEENNMKTIFGFAVEFTRDKYLNDNCIISPASKEGDSVECHDLSGFIGSWEMKKGGAFFPSESLDTTCSIAHQKARAFAKSKLEAKLAKRFEDDENMTLGEYEEELRKIEEQYGEQNNG